MDKNMYHRHEVDFKFNDANKVWCIGQPTGADIYLYSNGTIVIGYHGEEHQTNEQWVQVEMEFE